MTYKSDEENKLRSIYEAENERDYLRKLDDEDQIKWCREFAEEKRRKDEEKANRKRRKKEKRRRWWKKITGRKS